MTTKNVTCEGCYEAEAVATMIYQYGSPMPFCAKCGVDAFRNAKDSGVWFVEQTEDDEDQ